MEYKSRKKKTVIEEVTYDIHENISFTEVFTNGKFTGSRFNVKRGFAKKIAPYFKDNNLTPFMASDEFLDLCKTRNPFHTDDAWKARKEEPRIEDVDPSKIVLLYFSGHMIFDLKGEPIPIPYHMDYIEASLKSQTYDLDKVEKKFSRDPRVVSMERKEIPYYNGSGPYLEVYYLPKKKELIEMWNQVREEDLPSVQLKDLVISKPYLESDYLKIKKYLKPNWNKY